jgi:deoxyribonuclease-1-like protein
MALFTKRNLVLLAIAAGVGYGSQYYTVGGWQHLHLVRKQPEAVASPTAPMTELKDPQAWLPNGKLIASNRSASGEWSLGSSASTYSGSPHAFRGSSVPSVAIPSSANGVPVSTASTQTVRPGTIASSEAGTATQTPTLPMMDGLPEFISLPNMGKWLKTASGSDALTPPKPTAPTLRIATFNLQAFGDNKASKLAVLEIVARIVRNFDVIALQDITSRQRDTLPKLVDRINQPDRRYDYCIGPRVGSPHQAMHYAFIFDTDRIETDRYQLYTVDDPEDQLEFEPLVGWFRARGVDAKKAMTFSLVNLRIDPVHAEREIRWLPELIQSIQQDGRGEDDVIVAGDLGGGDLKLRDSRLAGMSFALEGVATTISGDEMLDNILFPTKATDEFTGRAGTVDFLRKFNLSPEQAIQVSNHLPVWCEFFAEEGGIPGYR